MKTVSVVFSLVALVVLDGCTMFTAWKSIPPPGGCDQCHTLAVSTNWSITYRAASIADERGRQSFQTPEYNQQPAGRMESPLDNRKVEEQACFECHKSPNAAHKGHKGRFHH